MVGTIKHISNAVYSRYEVADFDEFARWAFKQHYLQVDIETDVIPEWVGKTIVSIQFGSCTSDRRQYFFQWDLLTDAQKQTLKEILEHQYICKLAHNAAFEYVVLRFYDIIMENVYDTMLAEKVLRGGMENENYALADISWKYLRIIMDKTLQTAFYPGMVIEDKHIEYGINDVAYLDVIRKQQMSDGAQNNLLNVFGLEMEALLAFSDITYEGMILDLKKWRENEELAKPLLAAATEKINDWLTKPPFHSFALAKGYISTGDRITINFNAPAQKGELLKLIFPDIAGAGKPVIKAYSRNRGKEITTEQLDLLLNMIEGNYEPFSKYLIKNHKEYLINTGYLIPAGISTINWNSPLQVLPLAQLVEPRLKDLSEESRNKCTHKLLKDLEHYKTCAKLLSTYGEGFIRRHVNVDGKVRTNFNQVVSTGRVSSSKPNMQNIVVSDLVGTRYRNAFVCEPGWKFVDSDFASQELAIIAYISKDPVWTAALEKGEDLHSVCAELVHKKKWKDAAEKDCAYYKMEVGPDGKLVTHQKCSCKGHKKLRNGIKSINFGLAYGMSEIKLSGELDITVPEAMALIKEYFTVFPGIGATLNFLGRYGVEHGYIMTIAPFFRKRWFPEWNVYQNWIEPHLSGIKYVPVLGSIERQSKNMPIQGTGADMMKVAMVLVRSYIRDHGFRPKVRLNAQVHDQLTTTCRDEFTQEWKQIFDKLMRDAAELIVPTGFLKADTQVTEVWTK